MGVGWADLGQQIRAEGALGLVEESAGRRLTDLECDRLISDRPANVEFFKQLF